MAKASNNQFPSVLFTEQASAPAGPAAGDQRLFIDSADHHLKRVDSSDAEVDLEAALADHDHSGDAGDGGTFDAANLTSGASTDGQVLTSDGAGGAAWEDAAGGGGTGDVTWAIVQAMQLCNEVMGYPSMVGIDIDLDAAAQWWDKVGTPTTAVTQVDLAGEAGITETWEYALKTVVDAASEGFMQRYTYADQPRIKAGRKLSAIAAVWVGTAGTTVTMSLTTSAATEVAATATAQAWTIIAAEALTLDGTYVDLKFLSDTADTFYVVPLGVNIGEKALALRPRGLRYIRKTADTVAHALSGSAAQARTDLDLTAVSSSLAAMADLHAAMKLTGTGEFGYHVYPNFWAAGDAQAGQRRVWCLYGNDNSDTASFVILLDDQQVIEDELAVWAGSTPNELNLYINGYWEWE